MKYFWILLIVLFVSCKGVSKPTNQVQEVANEIQSGSEIINKVISVEEYQQKLEANTNFKLLDVRTSEEFKEGFIQGSINIDFRNPEFKTKVNELDKNIPTYVYCKSGGRSGQSATILKELGFKEVYDLEGGITEWINQGKPISKF